MEASRIVDSPEEEKTKERDVRKKVYRSEKSWPKRTVTENEERGSTEFCEGLQTISAGLSGFGLSK